MEPYEPSNFPRPGPEVSQRERILEENEGNESGDWWLYTKTLKLCALQQGKKN